MTRALQHGVRDGEAERLAGFEADDIEQAWLSATERANLPYILTLICD
jgi:hypothetical protein